jgi:4-amino-4-deoxy-L-arabinose transferase
MIRLLIVSLFFLIGIYTFASTNNFYPILYENNYYIGFPGNNYENPIAPIKYKPEKQDYFKVYLLNDSTAVVECKNGFYLEQKDSFIYASALDIQQAYKFIFKKKFFNSFLVFNEAGLPLSLDTANGKILTLQYENISPFNTFYVISNNIITNTDKYFTAIEKIFLIAGFCLIILSLIFFNFYKNYALSILLLLAGSFLLRIFVSILFPTLFLWDEQFHALVAKNMVDSPFKPLLYKTPLLPYDPYSWVANHVWLHKYPFFLWLMSISISIFGAELWAVRLPSALLMTITTYFIFSITSFLYDNKKIGYLSAFLFSVSHFTYLLSSGYLATDHNDVAFIFSISASLWAYFKYLKKPKIYWVVLIGLFSGIAILNKWLLGVFVYLFWLLHHFIELLLKEKSKFRFEHFFLSFIITLVIAGVWQVFITINYYDIAMHEMQYSSRHLFEAIEGHNQTFNCHFKNIYTFYAIEIFLLIPIFSLGILNYNNLSLRITTFITIVAVYLIFSLSKTKMIVFLYPFTFIFVFSTLAFVLFYVLKTIDNLLINKKISTFFSIYFAVLIAFYSFNIDKVHDEFKVWKKNDYEYNTRAFKSAKFINLLQDFLNTHSDKSWIVFNTHPVYLDNIKFMFFTEVVAAYNFIPDFDTLNELISKNYSIIVLDHDNVPPYIHNLKNTYLLKGYWEVFR